ncbi:MAG TPA: right-handed parallel beta-helix repeat-containing protein [Opitutales bacterium]|nr:right-handed parallel beta-helix repeat-containing protein [Opitutales bacterium]
MKSIYPDGRFFRTLTVLAWSSVLWPAFAQASTYYVAPKGSDTNDGGLEHPFATVQRAQKSAEPGDTVYLRDGTYHLTPAQIANQDREYSYVTYLNKSGTKEARINYFAYPGEKPVFDFSEIKPAGHRVTAFFISGSWLHLKGIEITGVQVTLTGHTQSECFRVADGSNNIIEQCSMHDGMGIGIYLTGGSNNLFLNCDAYRNWDSVSEGGKGGNVDGFGCHPRTASGTGNVFRGCRAWFNSDDGYDCINAHAAVTFDHCWAFYNGFTPDFTSRGDGNGFKDGGYGATAANRLPQPIPNHTVEYCLSVGNKANGFYSNHHIGANTFLNNTAYHNNTNFNMLCRLDDNATDVPGYGQTLKNNVGYKGRTEVNNLPKEKNDLSHNYFDLNLTPTDADFLSVDETQLTAPRQANGDLPDIAFMHLAPGSQFIDKGVALKSPYVGTAPDLGAFEYCPAVKVADAGFERPALPGGPWSYSGGATIASNDSLAAKDNPKAPEGAQAAALPGKGAIAQKLDGLIPNAEYKISFWAAQRKDARAKGQTWDVKVGDKVAASYAPPANATDYLEYTATFTATAPSETLAFAGTDQNGGGNTVLLDDVHVVQIANPVAKN